VDNENQMTVRIPLVLQNGQPEELQSGDQLSIVSPISGLTAGRLAVSASASTLQDYSGGTFDGTTLSVPTLSVTNAGVDNYNYIINGGFAVFQRTSSGTLTAISDDNYGPDRWNILTQTASVQIQRITGSGNCRFAGQLKQNQAAAQRMGLLQIIACTESTSLRQTLSFQTQIRCSSSQPIRIAILGWEGTGDSVTSDVVNDWTSGTYTAGNFFLTSNLGVIAVSSVTPTANVWTTLNVNGTGSANYNNLIVFIWTEGTAAQNVTLDITACGLYLSAALRTNYQLRLDGEELVLCQRYYEKSYEIGTAPGSNTWVNTHFWPTVWGIAKSGSGDINGLVLHQRMRTIPAVTFYTPDGTLGAVYDNSTGKNVSGASDNNPGDTAIYDIKITSAGNAITASNYIVFHWTKDGEL
jgi:hypothetical protein